MNCITVQEFIDALPEMLRDQTELYAVFLTYKEVAGHKNGPVDTGKPGLNISVHNGFLAYSPISPDFVISTEDMEKQALVAQVAAESDSQDTLKELRGNNLMFVIYLGLVAFDQALENALQIRQDFPNAKIITVTCDCDDTRKKKALAPLFEQGLINFVIMDYACGGIGSMRNILHALIDAWPNQNT
ncbi:MAG: hypothetical protein ABH822_01125 [Patescibacteria group bacterium]